LSIPTIEGVPPFRGEKSLGEWTRRLQEYLRTHLQSFAWPETRITLPNGDSQNVDIKGGYVVHFVGPTGAFAIGGLGGGTAGRQVILHNASTGTMTLRDLAAGSASANRIRTFTGDTVVSTATLIWDSLSTKWLLVGRM